MIAMQTQDFASALKAARKECRSMGHHFLCTEHLLLGLLGDREGAASRFLRRRGFTLSRLRKAIEQLVGKGEGAAEGDPPPSLRSLGLMRLAEDMARTLGQPCDSVALLWALLQDRDCDGARVLVDEGVDLVAWTAALEELMGEPTRRRPRVFSAAAADDRPPAHAAEMRRWRDRLMSARDYLNERMVGQDAAVERVISTLTRSWAGLTEAGQPLASFLFAGSRGSGRTTLARNLAELLYQDPDRLIRFNMDEFSDEATAFRLTGHASANPAEQEGILTQLALEYPYSVLFLEDADRAHQRALDIIGQILLRGHVMDGRGQRVDFRDNVIILSVTVDPELLEREMPVGFRLSRRMTGSLSKIERNLVPEFERVLGSEVVEALDELVIFPPLGSSELRELLVKWTDALVLKLHQRRGITVTVAEEVYDQLLGGMQDGDAEVLSRLFRREVENTLAHQMLSGTFQEGDSVSLVVEDGAFAVKKG